MARGYLQLDGWAGRTQTPVEVIGETPRRVRIRAVQPTRLGGRRRSIGPGEETLVPKHAVTAEPVRGVAMMQGRPCTAAEERRF